MSRHISLFHPLCFVVLNRPCGGGGFGGGGMHGGFRGGGSALRSDYDLLKYSQEAPDSIIDLAQWSPNYHERQRWRPDTEIWIAVA
jgi:hypothetical protein